MGHTYRRRLNTAYSILDERRVTLCPARVRSCIAGVTCPFVVSGRSQSTGSPGRASVAAARRPDHLPLSADHLPLSGRVYTLSAVHVGPTLQCGENIARSMPRAILMSEASIIIMITY